MTFLRDFGNFTYEEEESTAYPSYPGRANFSYISLQNVVNRLHDKQIVGSARLVTLLTGLVSVEEDVLRTDNVPHS